MWTNSVIRTYQKWSDKIIVLEEISHVQKNDHYINTEGYITVLHMKNGDRVFVTETLDEVWAAIVKSVEKANG